MSTFRKLIDLLSHSERKHAVLLMAMTFTMAAFDVLGIASIMPFMAILANPDLVNTNSILVSLYTAAKPFGINSIDNFLLLIGALVFIILLTSLGFKAITIYAQVRFALMREHSIGARLVEGYLHQPYIWFLNRNTVNLGKTILSEVWAVVGGGLIPLMNLISQSIIVLMLLGLLLLVDPVLAVVVGVVLGGAYICVFSLMSDFLTRLGAKRTVANQARYLAVNDAFGAVKEVKVVGLESFYVTRFANPTKIYAQSSAAANAVGQVPRFILEAIAFGGMILLVLFVMARSGGFSGAIPTIALYAFAGYRLMPALQQIYSSFAQLRFVEPALDVLHNDLVGLKVTEDNSTKEAIRFQSRIELENISFSYPGANRLSLKDISLIIPAHTTTAFVGATGSGKTTLIDLVLGLLEPHHGLLKVDGMVINGANRSEWRRSIGYVPQQIFLIDDTVAANIAFGVEEGMVDYLAVERAAKIANLHDFISIELPQGYSTKIGDRGIRLSGGQRQRIGIARAIYREPQLLILDEATSALDNLTEQSVMKEVYGLRKKMTIILIAHRLSTVQRCDQIFLIENGQLLANGRYGELCESNKIFQKMVGLG